MVKIDSHWDPLHNLHVISGRVLWRQQAEYRTGATTEVGYMRFPRSPIGINLDVYRLPRPHVFKLRLFEVGGHPDVIEGNDIYEFLPDTDVLADFRRLLSHDPGHRRANDGIAEIRFRLV